MITFDRLVLRNFGTWKYIELSLRDRGVVGVIGPNGGGKSTLFGRALHWAIYGKTAEGFKVSELTMNGKPSYVRVDFTVDSYRMFLVRFRNHPAYGNKVILRGKGVPHTDEDSLVHDVQSHIHRLFGISESTFATTVVFAQRNFSVFNSLSDFGKKEFLESLTYGSLFSRCEAVVREHVKTLEQQISRLEGELEGLAIGLQELRMEQQQANVASSQKMEELKKRQSLLQQSIRKCEDQLQRVRDRMDDNRRFAEEYSMRQEEIITVEKHIRRVEELGGTCPTCESVVTDAHKLSIVSGLRKSLRWKQERLKVCQPNAEAYGELVHTQGDCEEKMRGYANDLRFVEQQMQELQAIRRKRSDGAIDIIGRMRERKSQLNACKVQLTYERFWIRGFGFSGLRSMVLGKVIYDVGTLTNRYLHRISDGKIEALSLNFAKNKLVSAFGNRSYNTLSGGEKQIVDLCTGLAIREVAELHNKALFNLIVFDEPFSGLDKIYQVKAQDLLFSLAKPSTFVILHESIETQFDKLFLVEKHNGDSRLTKVYG